MPLLEVTQTKHLSASIRLTDSTATQVDQYAAFIKASANDVVEQALAYVFSKDREFQEFLRTPEAPSAVSKTSESLQYTVLLLRVSFHSGAAST